MDLASILDMLERTFADHTEATANFETASDLLRVQLAIEDEFFNAEFRSSSGDFLRVLPGEILASDGVGAFHSLQVDTSAALSAWKAQPFTNFSPVAAGLNQLQTADAAINAIIGRLSGFNGSLGIGIFPSLCWYSARYPSLQLGDVVLADFEGQICLKDIVLATDRISFSLKLSGTAAQAAVISAVYLDLANNLLGNDVLQVTNPSLTLSLSAEVDLSSQLADVVIHRAHFNTDQLDATYGDHSDPWNITASLGIRVAIEDFRQKLNLSPGTQISSQGTIRLYLPSSTISKNELTLGGTTSIVFLAPLQTTELRVTLNVDTTTGAPNQSTGRASIDQVALSVSFDDGHLTLNNLNGVFHIGSLFYGPETQDVVFNLLGAQLGDATIPIGSDPIERLTIHGNSIDLSGTFTGSSSRTVLFLEKMDIAAEQGTLKIVVSAVNNGSTTDPLSLLFAVGTENAIELIVQGFLSIASAAPRVTADRMELRISHAQTSAPINQLILSQYHVITLDSITALRAVPVPDSVLNKIAPEMLNVRYATDNELIGQVAQRLSASEFSLYHSIIDLAAVHHFTYLQDAQLGIDRLVLHASYLERVPGKSVLDGKLTFDEADLQITGVSGLELPNCSNIASVHPISAGDVYSIREAVFLLPDGTFRPGIAALSQQIDAVTVDISGASLVATSTQNFARLNLLPQLPVVDGVAVQVSIPNASLTKDGQSLTLENVFVDIYQRNYASSVGSNMRALNTETSLKFGIVVDPIQFPLYTGSDHYVSLENGPLEFLVQMLQAMGIPVGHEFDVIAEALDNPVDKLLSGVLGTLGDITGFGIQDLGIHLQTHDVTARLEGAPDSNRDQVAVSLTFRFPTLGPYVTFKYRVPRLGFPPWEDKTAGPYGFLIDPFPVGIKLELLIGYKINPVQHSIDLTDVNVRVLPTTGTPVDIAIDEVANLFEAIAPLTEVRQKIIDKLNQQFRIAFPDNLDLDLARIDFDTSGRMTISVEARETGWNPF